MPEKSHEIGRRQVMTFLSLMDRLSRDDLRVRQVADAYRTASRTRVGAAAPLKVVGFDAIVSLERHDGPIVTWHVESKVATPSSISKMHRYFAEFLVSAYCVRAAWTDPLVEHVPMFVFLTNLGFDSPICRGDAIIAREARKVLAAGGIARPDENLIAFLVENVRVFILQSWFQAAIPVR